MADLVTHLCTALLPGALLPEGRARYLVPLVAVGTTLPDLFGRAVPLGLEALYLRGYPIPEWSMWPWSALHEPFGWLMVCALASALFVEEHRADVRRALMLGCLLHTGLDLLQDHRGEGYLIFAPLSLRDVELGLMGSEATVESVEITVAATAAALLPRVMEQVAGPPRDPLRVWLMAAGIAAIGGWLAPSMGWLAAIAAFGASCWPWFRHRPAPFVAISLLTLGAALTSSWP